MDICEFCGAPKKIQNLVFVEDLIPILYKILEAEGRDLVRTLHLQLSNKELTKLKIAKLFGLIDVIEGDNIIQYCRLSELCLKFLSGQHFIPDKVEIYGPGRLRHHGTAIYIKDFDYNPPQKLINLAKKLMADDK